MANNLMSGTLSSIIKEQVMDAIRKGDTALANAWGQKKFNDCVQALFQGFRKLATSNCAMSGDDSLIGSAAIHWYTESNPTIDSIADILRGGTEVLKMDTPKTTAPKASTPKATPKKESKPKATAPTTAPAPAPSVPTQAPKPAPVMQIVPPAPPVAEVEDDDDDFDPLA